MEGEGEVEGEGSPHGAAAPTGPQSLELYLCGACAERSGQQEEDEEDKVFPTTSDGPMRRSEVTRGISKRRHLATSRSGPPHPTHPPTLSPIHHHRPLPAEADLSLRSPEVGGGEQGGGGIFVPPGATGSPCHPLTQTAGSALHTRIIRR